MPARLKANVQYPPRKMVVLTPVQDRYVKRYAKKEQVSHSEAVRQIIQRAYEVERGVADLYDVLSE